jgi:signal transduction histidine kinase/CheY-like chemotaxis protein
MNASERLAVYNNALNKSLEIFVSHNDKSINDVMSNGLRPIADVASLDRIIVFRSWSKENDAAGEIYRWDKAKGGSAPIDEMLRTLPITDTLKGWMYAISDGSYIVLRKSNFTEGEAAFLSPRDVKTIFITPVFSEQKIWGVVTFHDNTNERDFDDDCIAMMRSAARLCANTLIREERAKSAEQAAEALIRREKMLDTLNKAAIIFLSQYKQAFNDMMTAGLGLIADAINLDRIVVYRNFKKPELPDEQTDLNKLHTSQIYRWSRESGGTTAITSVLKDVLYAELIPRWESFLGSGGIINSPVSLLPEAEVLKSFGCVSVFVTPICMGDVFWGFVLLEDLNVERYFDDDSADIMRSVAYLCVNTIIMHEMIEQHRDEGKRLEALVVERTKDLEYAVDEAKKASNEAKHASEAKSHFLANMSHEMRTPMNVIVGLTDLLLEEADVPGKIKETLEKIYTAGNTLMGLINDVLDISKVEAGKLELMPVQYDVASLLNDIIALNIIRIESKPIKFELDIDNNLPCYLFGDDLRIKQILNNLLSNAFKYTKEGTVTLGASCNKKDDSVWVSFLIKDTGIGIHKENLSKLFTDYNQVDTRANREIVGTGLGLSITKKFVDMMDGKITVESEYGKGSTFHVRIRQGFITDKPIGNEITNNLRNFCYADKKSQATKKLIRPDLSYVRVLIVDDFAANLDVADGMLRKYKMQVDCVMNGQDAINRIAVGLPVYDAIFMDHMMPGMDGIEATVKIRNLGTEYAKNIPVIALTANAVAGNEQMFLDNGFNAFLPKPFTMMNLDSIVKRWIRNKGREQ